MRRYLQSGWLTIAVLAVSFSIFFFIIFVTFSRLREYAGGLDPFDGRAFGYSFADAQALLAALGEEGRSYYANVQLRIDALYPASYGLSRALALSWLAGRGRASSAGLAGPLLLALILLPVMVMIFDWSENAAIASMLASWQDLKPGQVELASLLSMVKSFCGMITETVMLALFASYLIRRLRNPGAPVEKQWP